MILFRMEFEISFGAATVDSHIGSCREVGCTYVLSEFLLQCIVAFLPSSQVVETESFGEQFDASFPSYFPS